jgi:endogenous inhibitor of DNA gyrase (YacG/DUF329 family)
MRTNVFNEFAKCWTCGKPALFYTWAWFCSSKCQDRADASADEAAQDQ